VDSDAEAIGRFHAVTVPVFGDIGVTARRLLADANVGRVQTIDQRDDVASRCEIWDAEEKRRRAADDHGLGVASAPLFAVLAQHTPKHAGESRSTSEQHLLVRAILRLARPVSTY